MDDIEELMAMPFGTLERTVLQELARQDTPLAQGVSKDDLMALGKRVRHQVEKVMREKKAELQELVCVTHSYCAKRKSEALDLAAILADAGLSVIFGLPVPATMISVYLLRLGVFDRLCGCTPA